ncbi:MAG TPA: hypothetical protein VHO67_16170, partial [Polyangia bacterium]|nr:hypothetical protein [Polyangia bacterium]
MGPTRRSGSASQSIYYALGVAAGTNTVTVVLNHAAPYVDLRVLEYSGVSAFDGAVGASGSSKSPSSGALAAVTAGDLLVASDTIGTATNGSVSGWTNRLVTSPDADVVEDRIVTTAGSYTASSTISPSSWWVMQVVAFKAATGSTGSGGAGAAGHAGGAGGSAGGSAGA